MAKIKIDQELLAQTRGDRPAELVLKNVDIVNVFQEKLKKTDVAISQGIILGTGDYRGEKEIDLAGKILAPGYIEGHMHLESTMVDIKEAAKKLISCGTTTVTVDPHEIANVAGLDGIKYLLYQGRELPWNFNMMLPSCVPSTSFETAGASLPAEKLEKLMDERGVFGLGEVMDYPGVIKGDSSLLAKLELFKDRFIDGHAPGVSGKELNAYLLAGVRADHESTSYEEAVEKVSKGMYVMIREGSLTRDMSRLLPAVEDSNYSRFLFATDDRHPGDLITEGHINFMVKKAVREGMDPLRAIRLATFNSAQALGYGDLGAIAPGYRADLVVLNDLENLEVEKVFKDGEIVAEDGKITVSMSENNMSDRDYQEWKRAKETVYNSVNIGEVEESDFQLPEARRYRVMELVPDQITTEKKEVKCSGEKLSLKEMKEKDLVKLAVVERHKASGRVGLGLLKGYGLKRGAVATSIGHDSHNIMVAGLNAKDMVKAVESLAEMQGGLVVVKDGKVKVSLPLPVAGLMSDRTLNLTAGTLRKAREAASSLGVKVSEPFMTISFMALPVIPSLKLTDRGLFDLDNFEHVSLVLK